MNRFRKILFLFVASLFTLVAMPRAFAASTDVSVTVNGYSGRWAIKGIDIFTGDQVVTLDSGTYIFQLAEVNGSYFEFTIDDSGNVTVSNPALATGGSGTLTLITHAVDVDVSGYLGRWRSGADGVNETIYQGNQMVYLPASTYVFRLAEVDINYFQYTVDPSGYVIISDPALATGGPGALTLITHAVDVDVSGYLGRWRSGADGVNETIYQGNQMVYLPASTYEFSLAEVEVDYFQYTVDTSGTVIVSDPMLASGGLGMLTLITHAVNVDVSGYLGRWRSGADGVNETIYQGDQMIYLAAATYAFSLAEVEVDYFQYTVDTSGNVAVSDPMLASGGPSMLTLITHAVNVDVSGYLGRWRSGADGVNETIYQGNQLIYLAAATYEFSLAEVEVDYFQYTVDTSGNVIVSDPMLATGGSGMLTLITHAVDVDVSGYPGRWRSGADGVNETIYQGNQLIYLAAATYEFSLSEVELDYFQYTVDTSGHVAVSDNHKAVPEANRLMLVTRAIDFDLDGAPGSWLFGDKTPVLSGNQTLCLAPATYTFSTAGNQFDYTVDNSTYVYHFTVSPNSAPIIVDGTNYTVNLSLGPASSGCFDLFPSAWEDLEKAIAEADIDEEGVRQSLQAKSSAACAAYEREEPVTAGNILCALLNEVDAQSGVHIDPASADNIRDTAVNVAIALGIPLKCN